MVQFKPGKDRTLQDCSWVGWLDWPAPSVRLSALILMAQFKQEKRRDFVGLVGTLVQSVQCTAHIETMMKKFNKLSLGLGRMTSQIFVDHPNMKTERQALECPTIPCRVENWNFRGGQ